MEEAAKIHGEKDTMLKKMLMKTIKIRVVQIFHKYPIRIDMQRGEYTVHVFALYRLDDEFDKLVLSIEMDDGGDDGDNNEDETLIIITK